MEIRCKLYSLTILTIVEQDITVLDVFFFSYSNHILQFWLNLVNFSQYLIFQLG